jgi:hypothetical protein
VTWYEFIAPSVFLALVVRTEAKLIGPYWAWLELVPIYSTEGPDAAKRRRASLLRRLAIPGIITFVLGMAWSDEYSFADCVIVAVSGAGLLLWPLVFGHLPWGVSGRRLVAIYLALVVGFGATGWIGRYIAEFFRTEQSIGSFLKENLIASIVFTVSGLFAAGIFDSVSSREVKRDG